MSLSRSNNFHAQDLLVRITYCFPGQQEKPDEDVYDKQKQHVLLSNFDDQCRSHSFEDYDQKDNIFSRLTLVSEIYITTDSVN